MPGRPRKPTAIKKLQGTLQKCRTNENEPKPDGDIIDIEPPIYFSSSQKDIWNFAIQQAPRGLLTFLDFAIFTQWVVNYDQFVTITRCLNETGSILIDDNGNPYPSKLLHALDKVTTTLKSLENELGFTPASRTKISSYTKTGEKDTNEFLDL